MMPREITAVLRLKINLAHRVTHDELNRDIAELLRNGLGDILIDYSDAAEILAIDDPVDGTLHKRLDVHQFLDTNREIAVIWEVDDVLVLRPELTDDQAWQVLQHAKRHHDAGIGLNWESLEAAAEALYGPEPETSDANP
jgi:hypothetical protein